MTTSWFKFLVAVSVALAVSARAYPQPVFGSAECIECMVTNADLVVVGTIVEIDKAEKADERGGRSATIAVNETMKGEHRGRRRVRLSYPVPTLADWRDRSCRLLVARGVPPTETRVIALTNKDLEVLTVDCTVLRKPERVIQSAKDAVRRMPGVKQIETFAVLVQGEAVAETKWAKYHAISVIVPVDERLEKRAHDSIRSTNYLQREEGARALRYFKTPENVARLNALLDDPGWAYLHRAEENNGIEVRIHGVRQEAYRTLKYWGLDVKEPTVRVEITKADKSPPPGK